MACGLHTASSNNMEEINRRRGMWVARRVVKQHGGIENKKK